MIRVSELKLPVTGNQKALEKKLAKALRVPVEEIKAYRIFKRSLDARKKDNIHYAYVVDAEVKNENKILEKNKDKHISKTPDLAYHLPKGENYPAKRPVVVGFGPAGMFAALLLAEMGLKPIVLERGGDVDSRKQAVDTFWQTGKLDVESNVQFGEGGAGTFSDGKLTTRIKDPRCRKVLEEMVDAGAPEEILYDAKPHIGTDLLRGVVKRLREKIISLGGEVRFFAKVTGFQWENDRVQAVFLQNGEKIEAEDVVLALGHSARDTFTLLYEEKFALEQKPFAMGVRIEHRQSDMDAAQYRQFAGHPCLPAASYKLSCHLENGRSAFSFCVCPGGQVVAAASEQGRVVTNGMSAYARDRENINGGLLVNVTPEDFGSGHPLAGVAFQRQLEEAAFRLGGGGYAAPCQRVEDFLAGRPSVGPGRVIPSYRPGVRWTDLRQCLPEFVWETLALALPVLDRKIQGYAQGDAVLTAVETRSSSPVRILRDESGQCSVRGLYPCGEGAGYAGGILSAAADGMRCAEKIWEVYSG